MAGTLLSYAITTDPDPLQASPLDGAVSTGALTMVVSNNKDDAIYCSQIVFGIPEGTLAQQLTDDDTSLQCAITPATWTITSSGGGTFIAVPQTPADSEITTSGLVVEIYDVQVNQEPGTVTIGVTESSSNSSSGPSNNSDGSLTVVKFPYGFFFDSFAPNSAQINDKGTVTLTWNASDGPTYTLFWGDQMVDVTEVRSYQVGPLLVDTTFLLQASYQALGSTVTTSLTTSVNVGNPEITASHIHVTGNALVEGNLMVGTAEVTHKLTAYDFGISNTMAALGAAQALALASDGLGGKSGNFITSTDGLVLGTVSQQNPLVAPPCTGTIGAGNDTVFVGASLGPPDGDWFLNQWIYGSGTLILPVRQNDTFGIFFNASPNNTHDPTVNFWFIPFGNGTATPTDPDQ